MKITLAYSPCPNDCFIFDALIHNRIDTQGLEFVPVLADVETLNQAAFRKEYGVTKLSYHAFAYCCDDYVLLDSGSALGRNCGPLLISKRKISPEEIASGFLKIAIPGKYTTANFLLGIAFPQANNKQEMVFSSIEDAVLNEEVDAGLIIHENRFTYEAKGLKKIIDLGEFWETRTGHAIPLGGIAMRRDFSPALIEQVETLIRKSVEYAFANPEASMPYVKAHAAEMDVAVMKKHIDLYVNSFSVSLGVEGKEAVNEMFRSGQSVGAIPVCENPLFTR
ncbi:MAG TPA: 1,4-dihydroxy-6-naphthoate synthase [Bacteroidia bacterium]|nr:1,4-dihydroxy-6-naphthoate synthase [Bacteroidia bacterium]